MNYNPTYAISLFFDDDSTQNLNSLINSIAEITGNFYVVENHIPPHITLGMFKGTKDTEQKLCEFIKKMNDDFKSDFLENPIALDKLDFFKNKIAFLCSAEKKDCEENSFLYKLNKNLHNLLLPNFMPACNNLYLPENYFPHCAVASGLSSIQLKKLLQNQDKLTLPITVFSQKISLAIRRPYKIIF
jgi:hypothetical protein